MPEEPTWPHTIVLLAGGASRRMGQPKHDLKAPDGRTMLTMAFDTANQIGNRVIVSGPSDLLPEIPHVLDERMDAGPMAGIEAVLKSGIDDCYLFMPCDMPGLNPSVIRRLLDGLGQAQAAILSDPENENRAVLPLVLRRSTLPHLQMTIESRARSIHRFLENLEVNEIAIDAKGTPVLLNINSPSDWNDYLQSMISE